MGPLFRIIRRCAVQPTDTHLPEAIARRTIRRRRAAAGIVATLGNDSFRAMGIAAHPKHCGTLQEGGLERQPRRHMHDAARRPTARRTQPRIGGADQGVMSALRPLTYWDN